MTKVADNLKAAGDIWKWAEELREASRGWSLGDPDDIQKIMNQYASYRFYRGEEGEEETAAKVRREKAEEMMRAIADDSGGWPQFQKRFCGEWKEFYTRLCRKGGEVVDYEISCRFDVYRTKRVVHRDRGTHRDRGFEFHSDKKDPFFDDAPFHKKEECDW